MNSKMTVTVLSIALFGVSAPAHSDKAAEQSLAVPRANFTEADADSDEALTPDEFVVFIDANAAAKFGKAPKIKRFGALKRAFSGVDADEDGQVTWPEFVAAQR